MADVELHLPPDVQYVGLARLVVCTAARQAGMAGDRVEDLRIAVSEATTNAIIAQQRSNTSEPVVLSFGTTADGAFGVTVQDAGPGFSPSSPEVLAGRDWHLESGLGITLIRGLTDDVRFVRGEGMHVAMSFAVGLARPGRGQDAEAV